MSFDTVNQDSVEDLKRKLAEAQAAVSQPTEEKADAPSPEAEVAEPEKMDEPTTTAITTAEAQGFLAGLDGIGDTMTALVAATETDDSGSGGSHLYPILTQAGGPSGGAFERAGHMTDEEAANLPEGRKPFSGIFIGYRFRATSWSEGYGDGSGEKKQPVFSICLPAHERDAVNHLMTIAKNYQFTPGAKKGKYDVATGGPGHIRPQLEILIYDPTTEDIITYQTPSHYNSVKDTRDQLIANATTLDNGQKAMLPFVGVFSPKTSSVKTKAGRDVVHHYVSINKLDISDAKARAAWESWQKFSEAARADAGVSQRVNDWFNCTDCPPDQRSKDLLKQGVNI